MKERKRKRLWHRYACYLCAVSVLGFLALLIVSDVGENEIDGAQLQAQRRVSQQASNMAELAAEGAALGVGEANGGEAGGEGGGGRRESAASPPPGKPPHLPPAKGGSGREGNGSGKGGGGVSAAKAVTRQENEGMQKQAPLKTPTASSSRSSPSSPPPTTQRPSTTPPTGKKVAVESPLSGGPGGDSSRYDKPEDGQHWKESRDPGSIFHFAPVHAGGNASSTPRLLHFMWVSSYLKDPYVVPDDLVDNCKNWQARNPKWKVTLWTNTLVREHLPGLVDMILFNISSPHWISDLARYSILDMYGGVYLDADTWPVHPLDPVVAKYSPFTVCEGYDDRNGSMVLPWRDLDMCRRLANGLVATPPNTKTMQTMMSRSLERSMTFGKNGTVKFQLGFTGPYVWKTTVRHDPKYSILSQKTFMPCGFRNPAKMGKSCSVEAFKDDEDVIGMHKLTWTR